MGYFQQEGYQSDFDVANLNENVSGHAVALQLIILVSCWMIVEFPDMVQLVKLVVGLVGGFHAHR